MRRIDAAGNPYTQEIMLQDGQPVDGEIILTTVVPAVHAGFDGDVFSQQVAPSRRKPPPPKRKAKGPDRGRRRKNQLPLAPRLPGTTAGADGATSQVKADGGGENVSSRRSTPSFTMATSWLTHVL